MKNIKLFGLLALSVLMLAGCNNGGSTTTTTSSSSSTSTTTTSSSTSTSSGEKTSFPAAALASFCSENGIKVSIPSPVSTGDWEYESDEYTDEDGTFNYFGAYVEDNGTIGKNSIEDTYKAQLEKAEYIVDEDYYEDYGYYAYIDEEAEWEINFYTYDGEFIFFVYGPYLD